MFCKNCGREIEQKTLEKMMKKKGETVRCSGCGKPLDTAEFCGGFWGLAASGAEIEGDEEKKIPGVTEADRTWARMILGEAASAPGDVEENRNGVNDRRETVTSRPGSRSRSEEYQYEDGNDRFEEDGFGSPGDRRVSKQFTAVLLAAALVIGAVVGRTIPSGRQGESVPQADSGAQETGIKEADADGREVSSYGSTEIGDLLADQTAETDDSPVDASDADEKFERETVKTYNTIKRSLQTLGGMNIETSALYVDAWDTSIMFEDEILRNENTAMAGDIAYIKREIESNGWSLTKLTKTSCNEKGEEINNPSTGFSRIVYLYDGAGKLESREYYAMHEGEEEAAKIYTAECTTIQTEEGLVTQEIYHLEKGVETEAPLYLKTERTFMPAGSEYPGALRTVKYYLGEGDSEAAREEIHTYRMQPKTSGDPGWEDEDYEFYIEESIDILDRINSARPAGIAIEEEEGEVTVRYYYEYKDGRYRLAEMGYYLDGDNMNGKAGFSYFFRTYSSDWMEVEDTFFVSPESPVQEVEDNGQTSAPAVEEDTGEDDRPALMSSPDPLFAEDFTPGIVSIEYPYYFRIP